MEIPKILATAASLKATEATVEVGDPVLLKIRGEDRTLFGSTINIREFEEGIVRRLDAFKRDELKASGRCHWQFEEKGIGTIEADVEPARARFVLPPK